MRVKWTLFFVLLSLAAYSPAPIGDRGPLKVEAERSQEVVAQEQSQYQGTQGPVGEVPMDTEQDFAGHEMSDPDAAGAIGVAGGQGADQVLREAARGMNDGRGFPWLWAVITALLGFGLVAALRVLANRIAPVPANFPGKPGR